MPFSTSRLKTFAQAILRYAGLRRAAVSFLFVGDRRMRTLNHRYLGEDAPTDVLAFSQLEGPGNARCDALLGDVVVSVAAARRQAPRFGSFFEKELILYMIHGVLHLCGFDDGAPDERRRMRRAEERIMKKIERVYRPWPFKKPKP